MAVLSCAFQWPLYSGDFREVAVPFGLISKSRSLPESCHKELVL